MATIGEGAGCTLLWLRHDPRLLDQPALTVAMRDARQNTRPLVAVYFFEPRLSAEDRFGQPRMGAYRAIFLLETLRELKAELKSLNVELIVSRDRPEVSLPQLSEQLNARQVFASRHVADEEVKQENAVAEALVSTDTALALTWTHTLYSPKLLPFALGDLPDVYTHFRKKVERSAEVKRPLPIPKPLPFSLSWSEQQNSPLPHCLLEQLWEEWDKRLEELGPVMIALRSYSQEVPKAVRRELRNIYGTADLLSAIKRREMVSLAPLPSSLLGSPSVHSLHAGFGGKLSAMKMNELPMTQHTGYVSSFYGGSISSGSHFSMAHLSLNLGGSVQILAEHAPRELR